MRFLRTIVILFLFLAMPTALLAEMGNLPATATWYVHADFDAMRSSDAGRHLYGWLESEVFSDLREDIGFDFDKEADSVTAWAAAQDGVVIVVDGDLTQTTRDRLLAAGAATGSLDALGSGKKTYYHVKGDAPSAKVDIDVSSFDNGAWFTFAVPGKLIVASTEAQLQAMIANRGKPASRDEDGALFVLRAERSFVQAGVRAGELGGEIGWDSNILRNAEQIALLVSDEAGKLAIQAELRTTEKETAESLASIVRGLISLQVFNDDMDQEVAAFLQSTRVEVDGRTLKLKIALDPELVVATLE